MQANIQTRMVEFPVEGGAAAAYEAKQRERAA